MQSYSSKTNQLRLRNRRLLAFTDFCDDSAEAVAESGSASSRILSGTTVGVKDIIDVAGLPTRNGSKTFERASPATSDAPVVGALREAGACIVGKTVTTEFAFTDPTDCRNPHDLARSPGGSSSGSGAAVGGGMVDMALGTQTAGSLCRPAAYCGVVGFKPSYGVLPMQGVTPLAPSFDTVGIIAGSIDLAARAFEAMGRTQPSPVTETTECKIGALLFDTTAEATPETLAAFSEAKAALSRTCGPVLQPGVGIDIARVVADHRVVMNHEAHAAHGYLLSDTRVGLLKPKFRAALEAGARILAAEAEAAAGRLDDARTAFWGSMAGIDAILTLPVPDGAPLIGATTGFQDWLTPWTVFGGPLISLPWGSDSLGRPRAVMLAGHPGGDSMVLDLARTLAGRAPPVPCPPLPG